MVETVTISKTEYEQLKKVFDNATNPGTIPVAPDAGPDWEVNGLNIMTQLTPNGTVNLVTYNYKKKNS